MNFFDERVSHLVQHVALVLEILAFGLLFYDRKTRRADLAKKQRQGMISRGLGPIPSRRRAFATALVVGAIAILMEAYQLLTQYFG